MSMVERVADALVLAAGDEPNWSRGRYLLIAHAAIEAMREPTQEMIQAGDAEPTSHAWGIHEKHGSSEFAACEPLWQAMIDAALVVNCGAPRMIIEPPPIEPDTRPTVVIRRGMGG